MSSADEPEAAAAPGVGCGAPDSGLYFRPDGTVTSCCSTWHVLGHVTGPGRQSLREIWDAPARRVQRDALDGGDFSVGCFECGRFAEAGRRDDSLAAEFDRYGVGVRRDHPRLMDFALSNRCNLQCVQCNGSYSSAIRRDREARPPLPPAYDERFFDELDEFLPHLERAQFKGGEPFLAPENRRIWDRFTAQGHRPEISVTTNGTVWNDRVARYTEELAFDVIVSVDAIDPGDLAAIRVGIEPDRFWRNVERFRTILDRTARTLTLSFCLMSLSWHQLGAYLRRVDDLGALPDVIWVDGPGMVNVLTMPVGELRDAARSLRAEDAAMGGLSAGSRSIWDDAVARIEAAAADAEAATAVSIGARAATGPTTGDRLVAARRRLSTQGAGPVLVVEYRNDVVSSVEPTAWSDWLDPSGWIGRGLDETMMAIAADAGATMRSAVASTEGGAHDVELSFDLPAGVRRLRGTHVPDPGGVGVSTLLLVEV